MARLLLQIRFLADILVSILALAVPGLQQGTVTTQSPANRSSDVIPGLLSDPCTDPPCRALCSPQNAECLSIVASIASTCSPQWHTWTARINGALPPPTGQGWSSVLVTEGLGPSVSTGYTSIWTKFSTASDAVTRKNWNTTEGAVRTLTPVYVMGAPSLIPTTTTLPDYRDYHTHLTGPKPSCKYTSVVTTRDCGQCTLTGGTVDLFFWPPQATAKDVGEANDTPLSSTVVNGTTMLSPSAYIHLRTVYASDECSQVGGRYTSTMLAMRPEDITTQVHVGGKAAGSDANRYTALNYADLVGLPPMLPYEMQPSCVVFGCPTIYPSSWNPTLEVPTQLRAMDPAWKSCAIGLEGLYDPPVPLTPQAVMAMPTTRPAGASPPTATQALGAPTATSGMPTMTDSRSSALATSIAAIASAIDSALAGTNTDRSSTHTASISKNDQNRSGGTASTPQNGLGETAVIKSKEPPALDPPYATSTALGSPSPMHDLPSDAQGDPSITSSGSRLDNSPQVSSTGDPNSAALAIEEQSSLGPSDAMSAARVSRPGTSSDDVNVVADPSVTMSLDSSGRYILNGVTLTPNAGAVIVDERTSLSVAMLTSAGSSFLAIGSKTTVALPTVDVENTTLVNTDPPSALTVGEMPSELSSDERGPLSTGFDSSLPAITISAMPSTSNDPQAASSTHRTPIASSAAREGPSWRSMVAVLLLTVATWLYVNE